MHMAVWYTLSLVSISYSIKYLQKFHFQLKFTEKDVVSNLLIHDTCSIVTSL